MPDFAPTKEVSSADGKGESGPSEANEGTRTTLRLSPKAREAIAEIMKLGGMDTIQEAVRRAISDELFLMKERRAGWTVLLQKGNKFREVNWPDF